MELRLAEPLVEKRQPVAAVKRGVTLGSSTCDAQHGKFFRFLIDKFAQMS